MPVKIDIDYRKYKAWPRFSDDAYATLVTNHSGLFGLNPRFVGIWDCRLEPGGNVPPSPRLAIGYGLVWQRPVLVGMPPRPTKKIDLVTSNQRIRNFISRPLFMGNPVPVARDMIDRSFPPSVFDVPYSAIVKAMPKNARFVIMAFSVPQIVSIDRTGLVPYSQMFLVRPRTVIFRAIQFGWCGEPPQGENLRLHQEIVSTRVEHQSGRVLDGVDKQETADMIRQFGWQRPRLNKARAEEEKALAKIRDLQTQEIAKRYIKAYGP